MMIKVLLVDDHTLFKSGIKLLLECYQDIKVIGELNSGSKILDQIKRDRPDIVIMDITMPEVDGLTAARMINEVFPGVRILFLTQHEKKEYIISSMKVGASGYILKKAAADDLVEAIRIVYSGKKYLDKNIIDMFFCYSYLTEDLENNTFNSLTFREQEVLMYLASGKSNKDISKLLHISVKTVEFHRANIMSKLGLKNIVELVKYAMRNGLTQ